MNSIKAISVMNEKNRRIMIKLSLTEIPPKVERITNKVTPKLGIATAIII